MAPPAGNSVVVASVALALEVNTEAGTAAHVQGTVVGVSVAPSGGFTSVFNDSNFAATQVATVSLSTAANAADIDTGGVSGAASYTVRIAVAASTDGAYTVSTLDSGVENPIFPRTEGSLRVYAARRAGVLMAGCNVSSAVPARGTSGVWASYSVSLLSRPTATVSVSLADATITADAEAVLSLSSPAVGTVVATFAPADWATPVTVALRLELSYWALLDYAAAYDSDSGVLVSLQHTTLSTDPMYAAGAAPFVPSATLMVRVRDDAATTVTLAPSALRIAEGGGSGTAAATITLTLGARPRPDYVAEFNITLTLLTGYE